MAIYQLPGLALNVVEQGRGLPLLLVHGFPLDHSMWQGQFQGLADSFRVIAPDLRGFGKSAVVPGTATMMQMADDLAALVEKMAIAEKVAICGLSMGGYVAWQFALRHPEKMAKLIVCDTRASADAPEAAAGRLKTAKKVLAEGPGVVAESMLPKLFAPETADLQPGIIEATRQVILRTSPSGIAAALLGMAERPDVTSQLHQIKAPALVICGEHDGIAPPAEMRGIANNLPTARYVEIQNAGHMAPLEQPAAVNEAIREFLR